MTRRLALACASVVATFGVALAAPAKAPIQIWGVATGDEVAIDGAPVTVRAGGAFGGEPAALDAPVVAELPLGRHEIVVRRAGCAERRFTIDLASKKVIVLEKVDPARCAIPFAPGRR